MTFKMNISGEAWTHLTSGQVRKLLATENVPVSRQKVAIRETINMGVYYVLGKGISIARED